MVTGIQDIISNQFINVYPNPTNGLLKIESELEFSDKTTFEIINAIGEVVYLMNLDNSPFKK